MTRDTYTYDVTYNLKNNACSKTGYLFSGWKYNGTIYSNKQSVKNLTATPYGVVTMVAQWTPITYYISYNKTTADGTETMENTTCTYDTNCTLRTNIFTKTGYDFKGWSKTSGGTKVYNDKQNVLNLTATHGATVTLYAVWDRHPYVVTLSKVSQGTLSSTSITVKYELTNTFTVTPTKGYYLGSISCTNGYTVTGFNTGRSQTAAQTVTISNNKSLKNSTCTVTFVDLAYKATVVCSNGTYEKNGNCVRDYTNNQSKCGCASWVNDTCASYTNGTCAEYNKKCSVYEQTCTKYSACNKSCDSGTTNQPTGCSGSIETSYSTGGTVYHCCTYTSGTNCSCTNWQNTSTCKTWVDDTSSCKRYNQVCSSWNQKCSAGKNCTLEENSGNRSYTCPNGGYVQGTMCVFY